MRKILLITMLLLSFAGVTYAKIADEHFAIGGICVGQTPAQVKAIYGNPVRTSGPFWFYNKTDNTKFEIFFENNVVNHIRTAGNTGLATPSGIVVGSTKDDVVGAYGQPDLLIKGGGFKTHPDSQFYRYFPVSGRTFWLTFEIRYGKVLNMEVATYQNLER